jgi:hypothetical protein
LGCQSVLLMSAGCSRLSFDDQAGKRWSYLVAAERDEGVWTAHEIAGGTSGPPSTSSALDVCVTADRIHSGDAMVSMRLGLCF